MAYGRGQNTGWIGSEKGGGEDAIFSITLLPTLLGPTISCYFIFSTFTPVRLEMAAIRRVKFKLNVRWEARLRKTN